MYSPLVKVFNYALHRLSELDIPGLPKFHEPSQIVFACSATKCIKSESYLQGSFKPDIVLVKWSTFKRTHQRADATYPDSYKSDICYRSGCDHPSLSWGNILSTLEVKRGRPGGVSNTGNKPSKGKSRPRTFSPGNTRDLRCQAIDFLSSPSHPRLAFPPKLHRHPHAISAIIALLKSPGPPLIKGSSQPRYA